jgi:hypothetical protein
MGKLSAPQGEAKGGYSVKRAAAGESPQRMERFSKKKT